MAEHDRTWNEEMQRWDHWNCQACIDLYWPPSMERRREEDAREGPTSEPACGSS